MTKEWNYQWVTELTFTSPKVVLPRVNSDQPRYNLRQCYKTLICSFKAAHIMAKRERHESWERGVGRVGQYDKHLGVVEVRATYSTVTLHGRCRDNIILSGYYLTNRGEGVGCMVYVTTNWETIWLSLSKCLSS